MVMSRGQLGERKRRKWWLWWRRESDHQGREEGGEWGSSTRPSPHPGGFRWHARPKARASCLPFPLQMRALVSPHRPAPLRSLSRGIRSESEPRIRSRSIRAFPSLSSSSLTLSKTRSLHPPALPDPQLALCVAEEIRLFVACNSLQLLPLLLLALPDPAAAPSALAPSTHAYAVHTSSSLPSKPLGLRPVPVHPSSQFPYLSSLIATPLKLPSPSFRRYP